MRINLDREILFDSRTDSQKKVERLISRRVDWKFRESKKLLFLSNEELMIYSQEGFSVHISLLRWKCVDDIRKVKASEA